MEKFVKLAFVAGGGALVGGALGAFSVERKLLKVQKDNVALQLDLQRAEYRNKDLVDQEKQQQRNLANTYSASMTQQWMRHQGMSEYEAEWRKAAVGPVVEKAIHALLLNNRWGNTNFWFYLSHNVSHFVCMYRI
jgi:hypothetical protein